MDCVQTIPKTSESISVQWLRAESAARSSLVWIHCFACLPTRFFLILSNELKKASLRTLNSWVICEGYIDMCEKDAGAEGFRAAKDETHP
jgi:hypothetical protein